MKFEVFPYLILIVTETKVNKAVERIAGALCMTKMEILFN